MNKLITIFCYIFSYKLVSNIIYLIKIKYYNFLYDNFLTNKSIKILQHRNHVIQLFNKAKVPNNSYPISQYSGCNTVSNGHTSVFTSFPTKDFRLINPTKSAFQNAIGIFKGRILECFSPKYWIDAVLYLPRNILLYLNIPSETFISKIIQIIYWILTTSIAIFSSDIANWIKSLFTR